MLGMMIIIINIINMIIIGIISIIMSHEHEWQPKRGVIRQNKTIEEVN